jgi:diguanylate cyclase (GGDEF)-like protein/PAS domain S-box-containing protein
MPRYSYTKFKARLIFSSSLLVILLAALVGWKIASGAQADRNAAFAQTRSFARAMSAHVESQIRVVDLSLLRSAEAIEAIGYQAVSNPERCRQILALLASASDASFWIAFVDAQGIGVAASNGTDVAGVSYANRQYFVAHSREADDGLYVGAPEIEHASQRRVFFLSRGVFSADRKFLGVVVASVDAASIAKVFTSALFQPALSITLLHASGKVVARAPLFERSFATMPSNIDLYRRLKAAPNGSFERRSPIDNQKRVFSYQKIGNSDLVVAIGIVVDSWKRAMAWDVTVALGALAVLALALVFSGRFALRSFLRLEQSHEDQCLLNAQLSAARDEKARGEKRARVIADALPALVSYIDANERYVFHNSFYRTLLGPAADGLNGRSMRAVLGDTVYASIAAEVRAALGGARVSFERSIPVGSSDRWFKFEYTPDKDDSGATLGFYIMGIDITDMKNVQHHLRAFARVDSLTGLPNRAQLYERLTEALARSKRGQSSTACLFLDIDHFKSINDSLGHAGGDEALREFGQRLESAVRETDLVARLAGDEFVIVLEGGEQPASASAVARKIIEAIRPSFLIQGAPRTVSTSVGIAMSEPDDDVDDILRRADEALYIAKRAGRGGFAIDCVR